MDIRIRGSAREETKPTLNLGETFHNLDQNFGQCSLIDSRWGHEGLLELGLIIADLKEEHEKRLW